MTCSELDLVFPSVLSGNQCRFSRSNQSRIAAGPERPIKRTIHCEALIHPHTHFYQQIRQAIWTLIFGTIRTYRIPLAECHKFISISENHSAYTSKRGILVGLMTIIHIFAYVLTLSRERYMDFMLLFVTERRDS